jgi:hypothetical protein
MEFRKIAFLIASFACGSATLAGGGGRGTSHDGVAGVAGPNSNGAKHFFTVRAPLPIRQAPASTGTARFGTSISQVDSRMDSRF